MINAGFYNNVFDGVDNLIKYSTENKNIVLKNDGVVFGFDGDVFGGVELVLGVLEGCC